MNDFFCMEDLREEILKAEPEVQAMNLRTATVGDWICRYSKIIIMALNIAILFVGRREKEVLRAIISGLKSQCDVD